MATAVNIEPQKLFPSKIKERQLRVLKAERNVLGSNWSFIEMLNGQAFWVNEETKTTLPSCRNSGKGE